ncbi:MAG: 2-polyprenyl-6-methoxyphenol hydroxylase-like oxidoreductase [Myxacorys californica WJT36-NPBG1]|jgi:2-polyprenyl-6-methoxyphenol hydroxylase-like FAD-dependent oxidoreductase|nr:2-polyprenyl-6-methoxyphenol hydroxylase-like oxidoreductase [Myxacorys californica WJT36-NPBG1]
MQHKTRALVIGGSLAGLLVGRSLANHFDHVTIVERDFYADLPAPRKGVPHSRFPHSLMLRGQQILEQFFPGLRAELVAEGAIAMDSMKEIAFLTSAGWTTRCSSDLQLFTCSRDLLDWAIRRRLAAFPNVQFLQGASVTGLLTDAEHTKIVGVSLHRHGDSNPQSPEELYADLIVDASGKASHAPQWLKAVGYEPPHETEVNAFVGYVARVYQPPANLSVDWKLLFVPTAPPQRQRGGVIFPIESDFELPERGCSGSPNTRWIVSLIGGDRDYPPTDEAGFLAFARSLPTPIVAEVIERGTPLTPIYAYYSNENRLRHYDQLSHSPAHFIVVGHAACLLNPTYGQAMTVAALEAVTLDQFLQHHSIDDLNSHTRHLQQQLAKAHHEAWMAATSADYRYRNVQGKPINAATWFTNWYWDQLMELIVDRARVYRTFMEVLHLLKPSIALFQLHILSQVVWHQLNKRSS